MRAALAPLHTGLANRRLGSSGAAAVQNAMHYGAAVAGVCSTANFDLVRKIGADRVVDYTAGDFTALGDSYDNILDATGTAPYAKVGHLLKPAGRLLVVMGSLPWALAVRHGSAATSPSPVSPASGWKTYSY